MIKAADTPTVEWQAIAKVLLESGWNENRFLSDCYTFPHTKVFTHKHIDEIFIVVHEKGSGTGPTRNGEPVRRYSRATWRIVPTPSHRYAGVRIKTSARSHSRYSCGADLGIGTTPHGLLEKLQPAIVTNKRVQRPARVLRLSRRAVQLLS